MGGNCNQSQKGNPEYAEEAQRSTFKRSRRGNSVKTPGGALKDSYNTAEGFQQRIKELTWENESLKK